MNKAMVYITENEESRWVRVAHVFESEEDIPSNLEEYVQILDAMYMGVRGARARRCVEGVVVRRCGRSPMLSRQCMCGDVQSA